MENKFLKTIESVISNIPGNQEFAKIFLSPDSDIFRYVVGRNEQSALLIKTVKINGIIDDFEKEQSFWENTPIVKSVDIPSNSIVVNCSTSISPVTVGKNLLANGVKNLINFNEVLYASDGKIPVPWFVEQIHRDYRLNSLKWYKIYQLMSDKESQNTLLDVMCYRLTANPDYMKGYTVRLNQQYFEDFMHYNNEVFVDVGGFDGDTSEGFCTRYPDYEKILFFEPSFLNMRAARNRLRKFKNIEYFPFGLSGEAGMLSFNPDAGSASAVSEKGYISIDVTTLDIKIKEEVSFIKMDIEGWELKALSGCKDHIINDKPKLAIAVYHNSNDFHQIPNYILSLNPDYDLYLRHYTEGWSETVMYFVPK
jgi:FkbM family methyltransferase